ncbi:MarR family winged helix-turn-helix transcriptional regulator [Microbispora rosea]|uniref:MarR family winged helix-turn-helix transcriptional regulator n=1 Tax=Microbispora rosea TaxID=58117 RepID=UPI0004C391B8|nr:MarR family transcriptional regulator [Microbispora rosea]
MPMRHQPDRTPDRVKDRPTWIVSRVFARSSALLAAAFEAHADGLRSYHYRLLAALEQWGAASQADLSRGTGIDRSDVTGGLTEMEGRGLIERRPDPEHKRRNIVTITEAGRQALLRLDDIVDGVQAELLAPLSPAQRKQFIELGRLVADWRA